MSLKTWCLVNQTRLRFESIKFVIGLESPRLGGIQLTRRLGYFSKLKVLDCECRESTLTIDHGWLVDGSNTSPPLSRQLSATIMQLEITSKTISYALEKKNISI